MLLKDTLLLGNVYFCKQKKDQLSSNLISYLEVLIWCIDLTANNCYIKWGLNIDQFVSQALIDVRSFFEIFYEYSSFIKC